MGISATTLAATAAGKARRNPLAISCCAQSATRGTPVVSRSRAERRGHLFEMQFHQGVLARGRVVLLDGHLARLAVAAPQPGTGKVVFAGDAPLVHD